MIFNLNGEQVGRFPEGKIEEEGSVPILLRRYPNLMCDLSDYTPIAALSRDMEYTKKFLAEFQDRLFFGTDLCSVGMDVPQVRFFDGLLKDGIITEEIYQKLSHKNAERVLEL